MEVGLRSHDEDEDIQGGQINQISSGKETTYLLILDCLPFIPYPKVAQFDTKPGPPKFGFTWWQKNGTDTTSLPAPHEVQSSPNQLTIITIRIRETTKKWGIPSTPDLLVQLKVIQIG